MNRRGKMNRSGKKNRSTRRKNNGAPNKNFGRKTPKFKGGYDSDYRRKFKEQVFKDFKSSINGLNTYYSIKHGKEVDGKISFEQGDLTTFVTEEIMNLWIDLCFYNCIIKGNVIMARDTRNVAKKVLERLYPTTTSFYFFKKRTENIPEITNTDFKQQLLNKGVKWHESIFYDPGKGLLSWPHYSWWNLYKLAIENLDRELSNTGESSRSISSVTQPRIMTAVELDAETSDFTSLDAEAHDDASHSENPSTTEGFVRNRVKTLEKDILKYSK